VTLSAVATLDRWTPHQKLLWRQNGALPLSRDTSVSPLSLGIELLDDLENNTENLNILAAASQIECPWLIMHGAADVTVSPREAERLYERAKTGSATLKILDHVGHLYNAASPADDGYSILDGVVRIAGEWLMHHS